MEDCPKEISAEIYQGTEQSREPEYPANAKRADALERLAESYLAGKKETLNGGDRYLIEVHTTVDTLTENGDAAESRLEHGEISAGKRPADSRATPAWSRSQRTNKASRWM